VVRQFPGFEVLVDGIVEPDAAGLHQLQYTKRIDGLADRGGLKSCLRRDAALSLRKPIAIGCGELAVLNDGEARTWHFVLQEQSAHSLDAQRAIPRPPRLRARHGRFIPQWLRKEPGREAKHGPAAKLRHAILP